MKEYKIGEVAKLLGLTTQALRFYEQEGVVNPRKSENGTRYYSLEDLHMMLCFKKYRMAEFTVQEVVEHFQTNTLQKLSRQLDEKSDALLARSEELLRRAQALRQFRHEVEDAAENMGVLREESRPELCVYKTMLNDLDEMRTSQMREISAYIDALPAAGIIFVRDVELKQPYCSYMSIAPELARYWSISPEHTTILKSIKCISTFIRFRGLNELDTAIQSVIDDVQKQGHLIDKNESIISKHIASEVYKGCAQVCEKVYIPIRSWDKQASEC